MKRHHTNIRTFEEPGLPHAPSQRCSFHVPGAIALALVSLFLAGCKSPKPTTLFDSDLTPYTSFKLREGDIVIVSFPGSPNLNTTQQIRVDGKIAMPLVGEFDAVGKAPADLEQEILERYGSELVVKEVSVGVQTSAYPVFVSGAVVKPGKIILDRPASALEAIMEAGGFDLMRGNSKSVVVIRQTEGKLKHYVLDLKSVLQGKSKQIFYVRPQDIIFVPERAF